MNVLLQTALACEQKEQWTEAIAAWQACLTHTPDALPPFLGLSRVYRRQGALEQARDILIQALEVYPESPDIFKELGLLFLGSGQLEYAVRYFQQALQIAPEYALCYYQLGLIFQQEGHPKEAKRYFQQAIHCQSDFPEALHALGVCALLDSEFGVAAEHLSRACTLKPDQAEYHKNLGLSLFELVQEDQANAHLLQAVLLEPRYAEDYFELARYFINQAQFAAASLFLKLTLKGQGVRRSLVYSLLAYAAGQLDHHEQALYFYHAAWRENPENGWSVVAAATLLPHIYQSHQEIVSWRQRFLSQLARLSKQAPLLPPLLQPGILHGGQNFLLAYQGVDNRVLLEQATAFWGRHFVSQPGVFPAVPSSGKKRIAIVSAHFYNHPVSHCFSGLYAALARDFDVACFHLGVYEDHVTQQIRSEVQFFECLDPDTDIAELAGRIKAFAAEILIYPEIGMSQIIWLLSLFRLAPVQCVLPGHPMTTGNAQIDYFISVADFEPADAPAHYTEKLVCTRNSFLSLPFPVYQGEPLDRLATGFPVDQRIYLVPSTLFKLHPDMDQTFALILERDPEAVIAMIQSRDHSWHEKLQQRFQETIPNWQRLLFLPWTDQNTFLGRLLQADIVLDTFHFGLGTTGYQALGLGVPVITWPGQWLRGRFLQGLYHRMGILDCIAHSREDYVEKACRLATDRQAHRALHERIVRQAPRIFDAEAGTRELVNLFRNEF